jgi:hypothetical protein
VVIPRPSNSRKFIIFPTPKYRKNRKRVIIEAIIRPLSEFTKRVEKVNKMAINNIKKNKGTTPSVVGLTKYIIVAMVIQEKIITIKVGKKFFLLRIFFRLPPTARVMWRLLIDFCFLIVIFYSIVEISVKRL